MQKPLLMVMINYCVDKPANKPILKRTLPTGFAGEVKLLDSFSSPSHFVTMMVELDQTGSTDDLITYLYSLTAGKKLFHATAMLHLPASEPTVFHLSASAWTKITAKGHALSPTAVSHAANLRASESYR